jgi:hypothetical protein
MRITANRRDSPFGRVQMAAKKKTPMKKPTPRAMPLEKPTIGGKPRGRPRKNPA